MIEIPKYSGLYLTNNMVSKYSPFNYHYWFFEVYVDYIGGRFRLVESSDYTITYSIFKISDVTIPQYKKIYPIVKPIIEPIVNTELKNIDISDLENKLKIHDDYIQLSEESYLFTKSSRIYSIDDYIAHEGPNNFIELLRKCKIDKIKKML